MTLKQQLIKAVLVPEESYDKIDKAEEVCDNFALDFTKYTLVQIYNMSHGDKAGTTLEELLIIYKNTLK